MSDNEPLVRKVDCVRFYVSNLETGLAFYRDELGHELVWRTDSAVGLRMAHSDAEIVLQTERKEQETDLMVDSADSAAISFERAGGKVVVPPFDIAIGRCVVVQDPWGSSLVLLDASKGTLATDDSGTVIGNSMSR